MRLSSGGDDGGLAKAASEDEVGGVPGFWLGTSRRYIGSTPPLDSCPVSEYGASFCRNGELEGRSICVESPGFSGDWGRGLSHAPATPHPRRGTSPSPRVVFDRATFPPATPRRLPGSVVVVLGAHKGPTETLGFAVWLPYAADSWITAPFRGTGHAFVQRRESQWSLPINSSLEVWFRLPTRVAHPNGNCSDLGVFFSSKPVN